MNTRTTPTGRRGSSSTAAHPRGTHAGGSAVGTGPESRGRLLSQPRLRRLVSRLQACLSALAPQQSQALVLRTGLGLRRSYTRRQVAKVLRVTLRQEGRIEQQAIAGLTNASAQGRCGNHVGAIPTPVLRAVNALLAATSLGPATSANPSIAASPVRQPSSPASRPKGGTSGAKVSQQPPPASASIAPPTAGGFDFLLLALAVAIAFGLAALWLLVSGRSSLPAGVTATRPLGPARVAHVKGAFDARRLRRGAAALAGVVGLAALREVASARRRQQRAETLRAEAPPSPHPSPAAPPVEAATSDAALALAAGIEPFERGAALAEKGDMTGAETAFQRADEHGHPAAASNLGVLLEHRGDPAGAEAAYRRADERGDATGAFNLAALLQERNDPLGAEAAYRRADARGDAAAAFQLGALMEGRNDLFGAEAAFRRADERGHPAGASNLGMLLEHRGDVRGAESAYRRADERGDATGAFKLAAILEDRNDLDGAEAAYRRASERGAGYVADLAEAALSLLRARR